MKEYRVLIDFGSIEVTTDADSVNKAREDAYKYIEDNYEISDIDMWASEVELN